ncbi:MAG: MOSC domain-containing protein [Acidobacteriota bacterium]
MDIMKISEINIYPVKSLKGIGLTEAQVEKRGLRHDRRWMLTDKADVFFTQREFPRMATIEVTVGDDLVKFTANGFRELIVPHVPGTQDRRLVTIWQNVCEGDVYEKEVNDWFSEVLETDCQLVYMPDATERHVNERFDTGNDIVSFADGYPLMLLGENSLAELNSRLPEQLPMNRFRPNLVVTGSEAFAEGTWKRIRIGDVTFRVVKPCVRCVMTTVDQATGEFDGKEPLKTLASYRMARDVLPSAYEAMGLSANGILFGENLIPDSTGSIALDDPVVVIQ